MRANPMPSPAPSPLPTLPTPPSPDPGGKDNKGLGAPQQLQPLPPPLSRRTLFPSLDLAELQLRARFLSKSPLVTQGLRSASPSRYFWYSELRPDLTSAGTIPTSVQNPRLVPDPLLSWLCQMGLGAG